tara:strand:+ start:812 stop:1102 length:291 start_codon:yes stop_codon:yes gene_type:complete
MAITKTKTLQRMEVYPASDSSAESTTNQGNPSVMVNYQIMFDDSTDDELPAPSPLTKHMHRYVVTYADDGTESSTATDVTGELQIVQDVCAALWTD